MRAHFQLPSVAGEDLEAKPPIQVKFEIPYFTTSGIQVKKRKKFDVKHFNKHFCLGSILKNHREERLSGIALGSLYHTERRLSNPYTMISCSFLLN